LVWEEEEDSVDPCCEAAKEEAAGEAEGDSCEGSVRCEVGVREVCMNEWICGSEKVQSPWVVSCLPCQAESGGREGLARSRKCEERKEERRVTDEETTFRLKITGMAHHGH
jgi:hypothetical protein